MTRFRTGDGRDVPAVTAEWMREVDRVAVEEVGLELLQMMEHAGRNLARVVAAAAPEGEVTVLAGGGGNGGGGLCCARHLANHGRDVTACLDRPPDDLEGATAHQFDLLTGTPATVASDPVAAVEGAAVAVDAVIGYGLSGAPGGPAADLLRAAGDAPTVVSLDVPSGVDATTGDRPGVAVDPDHVLTLALPKTGLAELDCDLSLGDLGIPRTVYDRLDVDPGRPFAEGFVVPITAEA